MDAVGGRRSDSPSTKPKRVFGTPGARCLTSLGYSFGPAHYRKDAHCHLAAVPRRRASSSSRSPCGGGYDLGIKGRGLWCWRAESHPARLGAVLQLRDPPDGLPGHRHVCGAGGLQFSPTATQGADARHSAVSPRPSLRRARSPASAHAASRPACVSLDVNPVGEPDAEIRTSGSMNGDGKRDHGAA